MTRRETVGLLLAAGWAQAAPSEPFRLAVCNETFEHASFDEACRLAQATGYSGLEIMPSTLSDDPSSLDRQQRAGLRETMHRHNLTFTGLHGVVSAPSGLHLTTPDAALRQRSWEYFRRMIDLCADLGQGGYIVLGSGKQRAAAPGESVEDARKRLRDGLAESAAQAQHRGVLLLAEPLAPHLCNVVTSLEQAVELVESIGHPAVRTMFDTHNAVSEKRPHDELLRTYARYIRHVHVNEMDGRHPGTGSYDFGLVLRTLRELRYPGWIALEVFQFKPSGEQIARESATLLRRHWERL